MSETDPPAPAEPTDGAATAPVGEGTTPDPQPSGDGAGDGSQTTTTKTEDGQGDGNEPPAAGDGGEGNDPEPGDGEGDDDKTPPADPNKPEGGEPENQDVDTKSMSRAERAQHYQNLEQQARKEVEARVKETYQPQSLEELKQKYVDQGNDEFQATILAREEIRDQERDIAVATAERAELNAGLAIEATEVLGTIGWLNPRNKEAYDKESSDAATELYDTLCLTRDENTAQLDQDGKPIPGTAQIVGATMTPKQFYGLIDKIRSSGLEGAKMAAQKAAERQMGSVAAPSSNSNKPVAKEFDQLSNAEKREKLRQSGHLVT